MPVRDELFRIHGREALKPVVDSGRVRLLLDFCPSIGPSIQ
jgi:hypothetical protein